MEVKTVEGFSMSEAIKKVKREHGPEAVILSTREKSLEGKDGHVVEVKIAVPEGSSERMGAHGSAGFSDHSSLSLIRERLDTVDRRLAYMDEKLASREQLSRLESGLRELKILYNQNLKSIPGILSGQIPEHLQAVDQQLTIMGVEALYKEQVLAYLKGISKYTPDKPGAYQTSDEYYRANAIRFMYKKLTVSPPVSVTPGRTGIHMFLGGSGVGKTFTIAKLVAEITGADKNDVLLISYDYRKLSPQDTLSVYAKILGVNHATIEDANQLEETVLKYRKCELILIDTSGGIPGKEAELSELLKIRELPLPVDAHLILSLTEHGRQMEQAIQRFSAIGLQSFVFSKLDECWSFGEIYNQTCRWSVPLSYFTTGPKISGGIEPASRERVMERLFGL